jgi:predicted dithiol-disulfide oxidoreductase (DUF899 family)
MTSFHTYSTKHPGAELLMGAFNWLNLAHKGRNENSTMNWVKLYDEAGIACCAELFGDAVLGV